MELRPWDPRRIGDYELTGLLGEGGMGQVFLGRSRSGRRVAVKLIRPEYAQQAEFRQRFAREVEAARRVGGFHAAQVVDADPDAERPWMVTAYIDGPSLQDRVDSGGALSVAEAADLGAHVAEGLAAIHACGLIHRDLKPGNVLLAPDGARIIDFGIARALDTSTLTGTGAMVGTCTYMSPEQVQGGEVTPASDVFSLGSVLGFAVTGRSPFHADSVAAVVLKIVQSAPDLSAVPAELRPVIGRCLAKHPADRASLDDVLTSCTSIAHPGAAGYRATRADQAPRHDPTVSAIAPPAPVPPVPVPLGLASPGGPRRLRRRTLLIGAGAGAVSVAAAAAIAAELSGGNSAHTAGGSSSHPARTRSAARISPAPPAPIRLALVAGPATVAAGVAGTNSVAISADGSRVAISSESGGPGYVVLFDGAGLRRIGGVMTGFGANQVIFGPGARTLLNYTFGGFPEAVWLYQLSSPGLSQLHAVAVPGSPNAFGSVAFSPDGTTMAVSSNKALSLLDAPDLRPAKTVANPSAGTNVLFTPDGGRLLLGGTAGYSSYLPLAGSLYVLDAASLSVITSTGFPGMSAYSMALSPDGKTLALTGYDGSGHGVVRLLDPGSLRTLAQTAVPGGSHVAATASAGFTPDGKVLAGYTDAGGLVTVWLLQVATMKPIASYQVGPDSTVVGVSVDLSADGKTLALGYTNEHTNAASIRLWHIRPSL